MYKPDIPAFSPAETSALKVLFQKHDKNLDGRITQEEFKNVVTEFATRPQPYQVAALFAHQALGSLLTLDQFMTWYWAFSINFVELAYMRFDLSKLENSMKSAAAPYAGPAEFKDSYVRLYMDNKEANLDKEMRLKIAASKENQKMHNHFCTLFKRQLPEVFLAVQFGVTANAALIATKLKELIDQVFGMLGEIMPEMAGYASLLTISTSYTENSVCLLVESGFPLLREFQKAFTDLLQAISPQFMIYFSVLLKSDSIHKVLESKSLNNSFGVQAQLRLDSALVRNVKDHIYKLAEQHPDQMGADVISSALMFLFEELKLDARIDKAYDVMQVLGLPENLNIQGQAQSIKQSVNIKEVLDSFLPGAYDLIMTIRNSAVANFEIGVYSPTITLQLNFKLEGLAQFFDLVI